jgi:hypothetical protein
MLLPMLVVVVRYCAMRIISAVHELCHSVQEAISGAHAIRCAHERMQVQLAVLMVLLAMAHSMGMSMMMMSVTVCSCGATRCTPTVKQRVGG